MNEVMPRENLIRASHDDGALEVTRDNSGGMPVLHGHAAVFNQWTEINSVYEGRFLERMMPGAFAKTISEGRDRIKVLFQHGKDPQIGDKPLGPLRSIEEDAHGLRYEVPLLDTAYNRELIPGLDAGLYGASFRFSVMQENFNQKPPKSSYNPLGLPERSVTEVRMPELGPVTFGAYANATSGLRSMTDDFLVSRFLEDAAIAERFAKKAADKNRVSVFFSHDAEPRVTVEPAKTKRGPNAGIPIVEERVDAEDLGTLACMVQYGTQYIADQDEADDQGNVPKMETILASIAQLVSIEAQENEPPNEGEMSPSAEGMNSEPESPGATTREAPGSSTEPELPVATTRSRTSLFWFVEDPKLKGAKQ